MKPRNRETYSAELDWFLTCRDAACGVRSSFAGQVAAIERGGPGGLPNTSPYHDGQAGLGPAKQSSAFARDRKMLRRWNRLDRPSRETLVAFYVGLAPQEISDANPRPNTEPEPDADGRLRVLDPGKYRPRRRFPLGLEGQLEKFSAVVIHMSDDKTLAKVLKAAEHASRTGRNEAMGDRNPVLSAARQRAERLVKRAHAAYYAVVDAEDAPPERRGWEDLWDEFREMVTHRHAQRDQDGVFREGA